MTNDFRTCGALTVVVIEDCHPPGFLVASSWGMPATVELMINLRIG